MSEKQKHTPGPWSVTWCNDGWCVEARPCGICETHIYGDAGSPSMPEREANARLIAAAPELLEAAKQALQVFVDQGWDDDLSAAKSLKAAIAKAEGKA